MLIYVRNRRGENPEDIKAHSKHEIRRRTVTPKDHLCLKPQTAACATLHKQPLSNRKLFTSRSFELPSLFRVSCFATQHMNHSHMLQKPVDWSRSIDRTFSIKATQTSWTYPTWESHLSMHLIRRMLLNQAQDGNFSKLIHAFLVLPPETTSLPSLLGICEELVSGLIPIDIKIHKF